MACLFSVCFCELDYTLSCNAPITYSVLIYEFQIIFYIQSHKLLSQKVNFHVKKLFIRYRTYRLYIVISNLQIKKNLFLSKYGEKATKGFYILYFC